MNELVFVIGPESSGTRGTTKLLISNGYWGHTTHGQPLDSFVLEEQPLSNIIPAGEKRIVFRRSIPHARGFPDLLKIDTLFLDEGYKTKWLIVLRDIGEIVRSKVARQHAEDKSQAMLNTIYEYQWILEKATYKSTGVFFFPFTYHIKQPQKAVQLLKSIEIL